MQLKKTLQAFLLLLLLLPGISRADIASRREADRLVEEAVKRREAREYREAIRLLGEAAAKEDIGVMTLLRINMQMADLYRLIGEYAKAHEYFDKAYALVPDARDKDAVLLMQGDLFFLTGDYKEGLEKLEGIATPEYELSKNIQKGKLFFGAGHYPEALEMFSSALETDTAGTNRPSLLQNIGFTYWAMDSLQNAEDYLLGSLDLYGDTEKDGKNIALSNYALLKSYQGQHQSAVDSIDLAAAYYNGDDTESRIVLRKKAEIYLRAGKREDARNLFNSYFNKERKSLVGNLSELSREERLNLWARERSDLAKCFLLETLDPNLLFEVAMFRKQTSLLGLEDEEALKNSLSLDVKAADQLIKPGEALVQFVTYPDTAGNVRYAALLMPKGEEPIFISLFEESYLSEKGHKGGNSVLDVIEWEDLGGINRLYEDAELGARIWGDIFHALPPKTDKIYFTTEGAFNFLAVESLPLPADKDIELHRVTSIPTLANAKRKGPVNVPSSKVLVAGGFDYNKDVPSVEPEGEEASHEAWRALADRHGGVYFSALPGTFVEADSISGILNASPLHELTEQQLKDIASDYTLIHLATHGYSMVFGVRPELLSLLDANILDRSLHECGVALTGANCFKEPLHEDNLISAAELSRLDLSNVDFVVLSACQTAKGRVTDEGSAGLLRGLKNAGAATVVVSLWKVDDNSTMMFMTELYRLLGEGKSKYEAYKGAVEYLKNYSEMVPSRKFSKKTLTSKPAGEEEVYPYREAYYWAPFIIVDDML